MKYTRWILLVCLVAVLLVGVLGVLAWINRPIGQRLTLQTPALVITPTEDQPGPTQAAEPVEITPTAVTKTTTLSEGSKICGNTGRMHLLVIGVTTPTKDRQLGANAIRLVTVNFDRSSASVLTLPAMLWVNTPVLADLGVKEFELSLVYLKAHSAAKTNQEEIPAQKATQAMAQTILDNFGFVPDHYITVDEGVFIKYVDALNGIEINLPAAVDGTAEGYGLYPAGPQVLNGTRALDFARLFHPAGVSGEDVWGNLERQNLVVKGILAATLKPQNWTKIPGLMRDVHQAVITDLSLSQIIDLACMVGKVGEKAQMFAVGENMVKMDGMGRMIPDSDAIKQLISLIETSE